MLQLERQNRMMRLLNEKKELTVKEFCSILHSSQATIRRDLTELEQKGLLKRSFGGAVLNETFSDQLPLFLRSAIHISEKKRICSKALQYFHTGETVFLDASSTTFFLAPLLKNIPDLTVITNNPHLSIKLSEYKVRNFCTGGEMLNDSIALVGYETIRFIDQIYADSCFFSARGFANDEISDSSKAERDVKIAMLERSAHHYFLCDSSKRDQHYPYTVTKLADVDAVIDEQGPCFD